MNWLIIGLVVLGGFIISLFFEAGRDFWIEVWEYIGDGFTYIISFEWIGGIGEFFSTAWESVTDLGDSPLINVWFWAFYIALLAGVWVLPKMVGVSDYTLPEKILYTFIFFIVDWLIISHFQNS